MKMSDYFKLPALIDPDGDIDVGSEDFIILNCTNRASIVAHAINCHDELVDVLERVSKGGPISMMEVENTLNRARGEA